MPDYDAIRAAMRSEFPTEWDALMDAIHASSCALRDEFATPERAFIAGFMAALGYALDSPDRVSRANTMAAFFRDRMNPAG